MRPPEQQGPAYGGDLSMAQQHGGSGTPEPPRRRLRTPFSKDLPFGDGMEQMELGGPTGDPMGHPAWNGGRVEPPMRYDNGVGAPGGDLPMSMTPSRMVQPAPVTPAGADPAHEFLRRMLAAGGVI